MIYKRVKLFYAPQPDVLERLIESYINSDITALRTARDNNQVEVATFCRDTKVYDSQYAAVVMYPDIM